LFAKYPLRLKPKSAAQFIRTDGKTRSFPSLFFENKRVSWNEMTLIAQSGKESTAYSFWESSTDAENYVKEGIWPKLPGMLRLA